ncbi:CLUMA_CG010122, isoform A [Clunio marinus]|uniref:CLUMA_CG010122, isoform A n=1 Tax=Clunio marinus TaxID=568069 RepID=A0A1J1I8L9_9DIPT|nr:CLUMA_CG010122, isoform A [Clunio marinus]
MKGLVENIFHSTTCKMSVPIQNIYFNIKEFIVNLLRSSQNRISGKAHQINNQFCPFPLYLFPCLQPKSLRQLPDFLMENK